MFQAQTAMLDASSATNEKIRKLEGEVHDLKLMKEELINAKNAMMREHDMNPQRVYELETELKELESNFASLGEWCQLAESFHDAKERELANIVSKVPLLEVAADEKERDLQKKLLKCFGLQRLLGLVINREGRLNSHLVRGICERLIWTTHM